MGGLLYFQIEIMEKTMSKLLGAGLTLRQNQVKSVAELERLLLKRGGKHANKGDSLASSGNISDMKILSPFYARPAACNGPHCACPYHRKLRVQKISVRRLEKRGKCVRTMQHSPVKGRGEEVKREERLSLVPEVKGDDKQNEGRQKLAVVKFEGQARVKDYNQQFDQFLKAFDLALLKKSKTQGFDLHKVKSSVGEIFRYIYTHLDEQKSVVEEHISKFEKDRDMTKFYIERYLDLRGKGHGHGMRGKQRAKQHHFAKTMVQQKHRGTMHISERKSQSGSGVRAKSKFQEREQTVKRPGKSRYHKLLIERMIEDVDCGEEVEEGELGKLAMLGVDHFRENCSYLVRKIGTIGQETLEQIRTQIAQKIRRMLSGMEQSSENQAKIQEIDRLIDLLNSRLLQSQQNEQPGQIPGDQRMRVTSLARPSVIPKKGSILMRSKRSTITSKDSLNHRSGFGRNSREKAELQGQVDVVREQLQENEERERGQRREKLRFNAKGITIFVQLNEYMPKRSPKLKLGKYRKLSHDMFYHKTILDEDDEYEMAIPRMGMATLEEISARLDALALQFGQKWKKMKEIEGHIREYNLRNLIVEDGDSLITAKRKARVFKKLLKEQAFGEEMQAQVREYLGLVEQRNYIKNRKWAHKRLKDMMAVEEENVELQEEQALEDMQGYVSQMMLQIFGKRSALVFYEVEKTEFKEKEVNFQQNLFDFMSRNGARDKKHRSTNWVKKKSEQQREKREQSPREEKLVQMGLNDKCVSSYHFDASGQTDSPSGLSVGGFAERENKYMKVLERLGQLRR